MPRRISAACTLMYTAGITAGCICFERIRPAEATGFLAASPSIAVIQAGRNNIYGHPHRQTLERLEERGIHIYRTDVNGTVGIDIRRGKVKVDVFLRSNES